jgi:hypothetical protein
MPCRLMRQVSVGRVVASAEKVGPGGASALVGSGPGLVLADRVVDGES